MHEQGKILETPVNIMYSNTQLLFNTLGLYFSIYHYLIIGYMTWHVALVHIFIPYSKLTLNE